MEFGKRLCELRKQRGMSQEDLAQLLDVTRQTVSKWEVGDSAPDMARLVALSSLFGITLDELVLNRKPGEWADKTRWDKFWTPKRKRGMKKTLRWALAGAAAVLAVDVTALIVCICMGWFPW